MAEAWGDGEWTMTSKVGLHRSPEPWQGCRWLRTAPGTGTEDASATPPARHAPHLSFNRYGSKSRAEQTEKANKNS